MDIWGDFETRSRLELGGAKGVGSRRYAKDPSTEPICFAYAFGRAEPDIWIEGQQPPIRLMNAIKDRNNKFHGWNALSFEKAIFEDIMGPRFGWEIPELHQYEDTMLDALALALPAKLEDCARVLGVDNQKMKEGKKLIQKLCKPISSGKMKGQFRTRVEFPSDFIAMYSYCKGDVRSERDVYYKLPRHICGDRRELMLQTVQINERGLPLDLPAIEAIHEGVEAEKKIMMAKYCDLTGLTTTYHESFKEYLLLNGVSIPDTQKHTIEALLKTQLHPVVKEVIEIRSELTKSSNAKYNKLRMMACPDGTVKNNLVFSKANTGRDAGAGFQAQNLVAMELFSPEYLIQLFMDRDYDTIRLMYPVLTAASGLVRSMIKAVLGCKFLGGDLKGIEMVDAAWVTGEMDRIAAISRGEDLYKNMASNIFNVPVADITKPQRNAGKVGELAGQFGGGWRAILKMAEKKGITIEQQESKLIAKNYRAARPLLIEKWAHFNEAAIKATEHPGYEIPVDQTGRFTMYREGEYLFMRLPSGRDIAFPFPEMRQEMRFGKMQDCLTAEWTDSDTHQWGRRVLSGPGTFQSAVQASACDVIMEGNMNVEREGMPVILRVHDETLSMVPDDDRYTPELYTKHLCDVGEWTKGMPVGANCWEGGRYGKK